MSHSLSLRTGTFAPRRSTFNPGHRMTSRRWQADPLVQSTLALLSQAHVSAPPGGDDAHAFLAVMAMIDRSATLEGSHFTCNKLAGLAGPSLLEACRQHVDIWERNFKLGEWVTGPTSAEGSRTARELTIGVCFP